MCDRRGLLLAEPFSVSVSASNVVVRISMKLLKDDFLYVIVAIFSASSRAHHSNCERVRLAFIA